MAKRPDAQARKKSANFMNQFRNVANRELNILSATQLYNIWHHYDADGILI